MKTYKVGGAVRDSLLGLTVKDVDWVVVGATPDDLLSAGYRRVGKDFPVFLHPETGEEYALARTERKSGRGYYGFEITATPDVTLEEDLRRRDVTINAIAEDDDGTLIDPFGGQQDLRAGVLRHISEAFPEDPLRVLRVARFAARFNFSVADETLNLMREMAANGELLELTPERVWSELLRALDEPHPALFLRTLRAAGALRVVFPEIDALFGVPQPEKYHPEIDTGEHICLALEQCARRSASSVVRFAVLMHDLGKGVTAVNVLPSHTGHEERGVELVENFCERFKAPKQHRETAVAVTRYHLKVHRAREMRPAKLYRLLTDLDALRRPERFNEILLACEFDATGRTGMADDPYPSRDYLRRAQSLAASVDSAALLEQGYVGEELGRELDRQRIEVLRKELRHFD